LFFELAEAVVQVIEAIVVIRQPFGSIDPPTIILEKHVTLANDPANVDRTIAKPAFLVFPAQIFNRLFLQPHADRVVHK